MENVAKEFITLYGPMGLGWVLAAYLMHRLHKMTEKYHDLTHMVANRFEANTQAVTKLEMVVSERLPK